MTSEDDKVIASLRVANTGRDIEHALNLYAGSVRSMNFCELMREQAQADRIAQELCNLDASSLLQRFAWRHPRAVALAERSNLSSHPEFVAAAGRVMQAAEAL